MKKLAAFFISTAFLALLAVIIAGLVIWFVGPLLAIDTLRPLASPGMRVTVIVLLLCFTLLLLKRLPVTFIGLAALSILVWHAGPLFRVGGTAPLAGEMPRLLVIALLVLPYLCWLLISLGRKLNENPGLLRQMLHLSAPAPESKATTENVKALGGIVNTALERLRRMRSSASGLRRLLEGKRYLYELPWYMVIGNAGAGKTTALLNAGLKLPLAEQMREQAASAREIPQGTLRCTWWLTNQAVLIDTAGRYANHSANANPEENSGEWRGFLGLLRKHRPRAPINGALLVVSVAELLNDEAGRGQLAAELRGRLGELREVLGIRFPVYVLVSKMDLVQGFEEYFSTLGSEGRNQVWGFTLPYGVETLGIEAGALSARCGEELKSLTERLDDGVNNRLLEEYDAGRSKRLSLLPLEFDKLRGALLQFLDDVFQESRYDATQVRTTLRGVYFASASQTLANSVAADRDTLWQRLRWRFTGENAKDGSESGQTLTGNRSYFLHDLFQRLIFPEASLVRPNLRWEWRFRTLRLIGHTLVLFVFAWFITAIWISSGKNSAYLAEVRQKTAALTPRLKEYLARPDSTQVAGLLDQVRDLPTYPGLDRDQPASDWRYGLYTGDSITGASTVTQAVLEDRILLPFVTRRMETALVEAIRRQDETAVYDALRTQLLLYSKDRYNAADVRRWVLRDWEHGSAGFGGQGAMLWHLRHLFDGSRVVQAGGAIDETTVSQARALLDSKPSLTRLYERLKATIHPDSPEDFTVLRAVGPQAGAIFRRQSGASLDSGIPGLFTYAGYHELFNKRLPEFLGKARNEDDWVMGREVRGGDGAKVIAALDPDDRLANEIRRLYLNEYAGHWTAFLDDIRPLTGDTRAFDLQIMRALAAPDSPLMRLARAAVKETTLTRPITQQDDSKSLLDKAQEEIARKARAVAGDFGLRGEIIMERQLVDSRFAALREIVTGDADADASGEKSGGAGTSGLDAIAALINDYYTQLVVADNTLSANGIPPADQAGTRLGTEATRLPAPFRGVLTELSFEGARKINASIGEILIAQADNAVGDFCRRAVEGKYPFAAAGQETDPDDFARLFSSGGLFDSFFEQNLKPYVDTATQPWRYKRDNASMPPIEGPPLESFAQARRIRDAFFRAADGKRLGWKAEVRIAEMDPAITDLTLDIDGQVLRYAHGPNLPWNMVWPGPRGGVQAELTANPRVRADTSVFRFNGPWAVFRLLEHGQIQPSATSGRVAVEFAPDERRIVLDIGTGTQSNPLSSDLLRGFRCPGGTT